MKALIKDLRGILVSNAIIAAILNRKPKKEKGYRPDMSKWANARPLEAGSEPVVLSVADIKRIMDEHEERVKNPTPIVDDKKSAQTFGPLELRNMIAGGATDEEIFPLLPQHLTNKEMAGIVTHERVQYEIAEKNIGKIFGEAFDGMAALGKPNHERDTQAIAKQPSTMVRVAPSNRSFSDAPVFENRQQRRLRERDEARNKKTKK